MKSIESLNKKITNCKKCPRLAVYIRDVAKNKVRRFKDEKYYGKPLSGFGDVNAKLLIRLSITSTLFIFLRDLS